MNLSDYLEKLQNKPRLVRVAILWTSVAISMTIIFVFWAWSLKGKESQIKLSQEKKSQQTQETRSLSEFKKEIPTLWQSLKAAVSGLLKEGVESLQSQEGQENQPDIKIESAEPKSSEKVPPAELP